MAKSITCRADTTMITTVGTDDGTPVTEDYKEGNNKFTGRINSVMIELKEMKIANADVKQAAHEAAKRKLLAD